MTGGTVKNIVIGANTSEDVLQGPATTATQFPASPITGWWWIVAEAGTVLGVPGCVVGDEIFYADGVYFKSAIGNAVDQTYTRKVMTGDLNANSYKITQLADAVADSDALSLGRVKTELLEPQKNKFDPSLAVDHKYYNNSNGALSNTGSE